MLENIFNYSIKYENNIAYIYVLLYQNNASTTYGSPIQIKINLRGLYWEHVLHFILCENYG